MGYVYIRYPIVFVNDNYYELFKNYLIDYNYISLIHVDSFEKKYLYIKENVLYKVFNITLEDKLFSVEDLWFYTNSI